MSRAGLFAPLRRRDFRLLWIGQVVSSLGTGMYPVAIAFGVLELDGSTSALASVLLVSFLPQVAFFLIGGVVADRAARERVMLVSAIVKGTAEGLLAVLLLSGQAHLWHFLLLGVVYGTATAFGSPAEAGLIPTLVPEDEVQTANALFSLSRSTSGFLGPALAGVLVAASGAGWALGIDAMTFFVFAAALAMMRRPDRPRHEDDVGEKSSFVSDLAVGWKEVRSRTWVWVSILYFAIGNLALAPLAVLGPFVAERSLGGARAWGIITAAETAGALVGGLAALRFKPSRPLFIGYLVVAAAGLEPILLGRPSSVPVIAVAAVIAFATVEFTITLWFTSLQQHVPKTVLSRVSSYDYLGSYITLPLGYILSSLLSSWIGIGPTLTLCGGLIAISSVTAACVPSVRGLRRIEAEPDATEPEVGIQT